MVQAADNPPTDKTGEATGTTTANAVNAGDVLLSNPQDSLNRVRSERQQQNHHVSTLQDYNRLTDAMHLAQLVSTPENSTPIATVDLEFGRYYVDLPQLDALSYSKAKANIEDAVQIYERNHDRGGELKALKEELELVQKMNPNPTIKQNEKTEAQQLQERISKLSQLDNALEEYGQDTNGKGKDNNIATSLDHLGKAYASQDNKEQADKSFQKAFYLLDHSGTNDQAVTLQVLKDYSAFMHTTNYGDPSFIDDRIKQLGGTVGASEQAQSARSTNQGSDDQHSHDGGSKSESSTDNPSESAQETQLQRYFNLTLEMFGSSSDQVAEAANELGDFYKSKGPGFENQAREFYAQALAVYDRSDRPLTGEATTLVNYADLFESSDPQKAIALRKRGEGLLSLASNTQTLSEEIGSEMSPEAVVNSLCNLASSYARVGNNSKAESLFAEAVTMHANNQLGDSDSTYERYAEYLKSQGRNIEATHFMDLYNAEKAASQIASSSYPQ